MTHHLEALSQLFGTYLHQDWADEFASDTEAVEAMMVSEPPEIIVAATNELRQLLAAGLEEAELLIIMTDEAGCYFNPASKGQTYRTWLDEILAQWEAKVR